MTIIELLLRFGPMTTGRAAELLVQSGSSPAAARKAISRRPQNVLTLLHMPFPKNSRFIYLEQQFGTEEYWKNLAKAIDEANPAYAAALSSLRAGGGVVPERYFDIVCGSPIKQKKQLSSRLVLDRLERCLLVTRIPVDGFGECVALGGVTPTNHQLKKLRARILTENVLLDAIRTWAGRMNICSPNVAKIRDDWPPPQVGTFLFDLSGPSYLLPLQDWAPSQVKPGFFVADAILGRELDEEMVKPFLRKCEMLSRLGRSRPFLPMLIADAFHFDALNALRKRGVIATRPETLFGQDVAHALRDLLFMLANASAAANSDSARIEVLFGKLAAVEGAAGNLRGALFELIVGHCVRAIEGGEVEIGAVVVNAKRRTRAEIDVRLRREKVVKLCECKGYQPDSEVGLEEVEEWLTEKIPTIYGAMKEDDAFAPSGFEFEFWTCGSFGVDAMSRLLDAKAKTSKYKISWKDGAQIKEYAAGLASPGIKRILREHYFDDPVKVFGKSISEKKKRDRHGQLAAQMPSKESNDLRITDIDSYLPDGSSPF